MCNDCFQREFGAVRIFQRLISFRREFADMHVADLEKQAISAMARSVGCDPANPGPHTDAQRPYFRLALLSEAQIKELVEYTTQMDEETRQAVVAGKWRSLFEGKWAGKMGCEVIW